ncbi:MAG TPA: archaeal proteasome endopeptidase complex subunit beta [Candidatus Nanoarchaeia archaeon]|nr:archaeal proteasome endopeptidase complex subunit beta [Candidatus Nanoarchaeia archaeon]
MEGYGPQTQTSPSQAQQGGISWVPGATTVGIVCSDGIILASEKRVSYGFFIASKGGKKVFKITSSIGAACAGLVSDMQVLVRDVEANANLFSMDVGRKISVRAAAKLMSNILFNRRMMPLITQTIVGGLDDDGPSLWVLDVLGSVLPDDYAVVGTGTEIAIAVIEEGYRKDIKVAEAKDLVTRAIKSAISRDTMSGDGIDMLIITKHGMTEESVKF